MADIPKPEETGSEGTQKASEAEVVSPAPDSPLAGLPITRTVEGLAATRSRSLGGEVAANLIAGSFNQISHELREVKEELRNTRQKLESAQEHLSQCKQRAAVLDERVRSSSRNRHLRNISITIGTAVVGIAIELLRNNFDKTSYLAGALGLLLICLGWFTTDERTDK